MQTMLIIQRVLAIVLLFLRLQQSMSEKYNICDFKATDHYFNLENQIYLQNLSLGRIWKFEPNLRYDRFGNHLALRDRVQLLIDQSGQLTPEPQQIKDEVPEKAFVISQYLETHFNLKYRIHAITYKTNISCERFLTGEQSGHIDYMECRQLRNESNWFKVCLFGVKIHQNLSRPVTVAALKWDGTYLYELAGPKNRDLLVKHCTELELNFNRDQKYPQMDGYGLFSAATVRYLNNTQWFMFVRNVTFWNDTHFEVAHLQFRPNEENATEQYPHIYQGPDPFLSGWVRMLAIGNNQFFSFDQHLWDAGRYPDWHSVPLDRLFFTLEGKHQFFPKQMRSAHSIRFNRVLGCEAPKPNEPFEFCSLKRVQSVFNLGKDIYFQSGGKFWRYNTERYTHEDHKRYQDMDDNPPKIANLIYDTEVASFLSRYFDISQTISGFTFQYYQHQALQNCDYDHIWCNRILKNHYIYDTCIFGYTRSGDQLTFDYKVFLYTPYGLRPYIVTDETLKPLEGMADTMCGTVLSELRRDSVWRLAGASVLHVQDLPLLAVGVQSSGRLYLNWRDWDGNVKYEVIGFSEHKFWQFTDNPSQYYAWSAHTNLTNFFWFSRDRSVYAFKANSSIRANLSRFHEQTHQTQKWQEWVTQESIYTLFNCPFKQQYSIAQTNRFDLCDHRSVDRYRSFFSIGPFIYIQISQRFYRFDPESRQSRYDSHVSNLFHRFFDTANGLVTGYSGPIFECKDRQYSLCDQLKIGRFTAYGTTHPKYGYKGPYMFFVFYYNVHLADGPHPYVMAYLEPMTRIKNNGINSFGSFNVTLRTPIRGITFDLQYKQYIKIALSQDENHTQHINVYDMTDWDHVVNFSNPNHHFDWDHVWEYRGEPLFGLKGGEILGVFTYFTGNSTRYTNNVFFVHRTYSYKYQTHQLAFIPYLVDGVALYDEVKRRPRYPYTITKLFCDRLTGPPKASTSEDSIYSWLQWIDIVLVLIFLSIGSFLAYMIVKYNSIEPIRSPSADKDVLEESEQRLSETYRLKNGNEH